MMFLRSKSSWVRYGLPSMIFCEQASPMPEGLELIFGSSVDIELLGCWG